MFASLLNRIIVAALLIIAFSVLVVLDSFWLNFVVFALLLCVAMYESLPLYGLNQKFLIIIALVFFSFSIFLNPLFAMLTMLCLVAGGVAFVKSPEPKLILPFLYPAAPVFALFALLNECGMPCLVWLVITVAISDTAAFACGKILHLKKPDILRSLSPASPNKSIQGALAGVILGSFVGALYASIFVDVSFGIALGASVLACVFGVFGDLFESYLKRLRDVKDSGKILGEHGGVLDRFDAIFFGAIAMLVVLD